MERVGMELSARNQLSGTVQTVSTGDVVAEVEIELDGGETITSTITRGSVERLGLEEGVTVEAVVKASDVMVQSE